MDVEDDARFPPTEAEANSDHQLALRTAWASLTGYAVWVHPAVGAAATAVTPVFDAIATFAVKRLGERRIEHAAETLLDAAETADEPLADFIDKAVADDQSHELFARTLTTAQDTALRSKRRALGRALAAGVMGDNARIDEELLFVRAVADIDEMHIRLLARLAGTEGKEPGLLWTSRVILHSDPGLSVAFASVAATLQLHGLITAPTEADGSFIRTHYEITDWGREVLDRLAGSAN